MKAIIFPRPGQVEIQEFPTPVCGEEDILVRALYTLVSSGTELRGFSKDRVFSTVFKW